MAKRLKPEHEQLLKEQLAVTKGHELRNQYAERIGTAIAVQKKYFKRRETFTDFKEPLMLLERSDGATEMYHNVKEHEFNVPELPEGVEKKIILGKQFQKRFPYAGREVRYYDCHEDWAFPHIWSRPNVYTGAHSERIKTYIHQYDIDKGDMEKGHPKGVPIILEAANVNSEAMRDRERKVLIAWERFTAGQKALNIKAWAKFILYAAAGVALVFFVWKMFGPDPAVQVAGAVQQAASNATSAIVTIGG